MRCKKQELVKIEFSGGLVIQKSKEYLKNMTESDINKIIKYYKANKNNGNSISAIKIVKKIIIMFYNSNY